MTITTKVQVEQDRAVTLDAPKYIKFHNGIFLRYVPVQKENRIEVIRLTMMAEYTSLDFRESASANDLDLLINENKAVSEITEEEFHAQVSKYLIKHDLL